MKGQPGRFVDLASIRVHYYDLGEGPALVLVHGSGPGADGWSTFSGNLPILAARHRCLVIDLPQFGRSDKVVIREGRPSYYANILSQFLDALNLAKADFVGLSMGGQSCIKLAIDAPDRVANLVVIAGPPLSRGLFTPLPSEGGKLIHGYYRGEGPTLEKMSAYLKTVPHDPSLITEEMIQQRYEASLDPSTIEVLSRPIAPEDLRDRLPEVKARTLLIWGGADRFAPLDAGLLMYHLIPQADLHVFKDTGHWPHVERADEFNRLVLDFLGSQR